MDFFLERPKENNHMLSVRTLTHGVSALVAIVILATTAMAATTQTTSSKALLLSPHVHIGQSITWKGQLRERSVIPSNRGPVEHFDSRADILTCTILRGGSNAFFVSRQAKLDAGHNKTFAVYRNGSVSQQRIVVEPIRSGCSSEYGTAFSLKVRMSKPVRPASRYSSINFATNSNRGANR